MKPARISLAALVAVALWAGGGSAQAQENCEGQVMKPGTLINSQNLDCARQMTFHGAKIGDMLTDKVDWQIREWGLEVEVQDPIAPNRDARLMEATERYKDTIKLDPMTRNLVNYKTGVPFPDVDENSEHLALKIIWNYIYGHPHSDVQDFNKFAYLLIDGDTGLERKQYWGYVRYWMTGQIADIDNPTRGDGTVIDKLLLWAWYPQDIRGLGTFTLRYNTGKLPDTWAYIRTVRRIRRLSGGAWFDPIGGTDQLNDDIECFNAHPNWYQDFKLMGKRKVLAVFNSRRPTWKPDASSEDAQFPRVDLTEAPFWNVKDRWEPRDVWVVESIPPQEHPYSKKEFYVDAINWRPVYADMYDKAGAYWKHCHAAAFEFEAEDGYPAMASAWGQVVDFQRRHATIWNLHDSIRTNPSDVTETDVTLQQLEDQAN